MIDVVLVAGLARKDHLGRRRRRVSRQVADLGRGLGIAGEKNDLPVERAARTDVEELALLFVEEVARRRTDCVTPELVGPLRDGVLGRVEERLVVGRPDNRPDPFDVLGQHLTLAQVLHVQAVLPVAGRIRGICQPVAVVAGDVGAETEKLVPLGKRVEIEEELLGSIHAALAAAHVGVLLPLFRARVIKVLADARRHTEVGLLDAAEHLRVERLLQHLGRLHHLFGVGVLALQVLDDLRVALLPEPEVVVLEGVAVDVGGVRLLRRDRRLRPNGLLGVSGRCYERHGQKRHDQRHAVLRHTEPLLERGRMRDLFERLMVTGETSL